MLRLLPDSRRSEAPHTFADLSVHFGLHSLVALSHFALLPLVPVLHFSLLQLLRPLVDARVERAISFEVLVLALLLFLVHPLLFALEPFDDLLVALEKGLRIVATDLFVVHGRVVVLDDGVAELDFLLAFGFGQFLLLFFLEKHHFGIDFGLELTGTRFAVRVPRRH